MLKYTTSLKPPPIATNMDPGQWTKTPYQYPGAHRDVLNAVGGANAAAQDLATSRASTDQQMASQEAQRQLVLQGLQQLSGAQQNSHSLQNSRLQALTGTANSLLGGLFS